MHRLCFFQTRFFPLICKFYDQNTVLGHKAYEDDDTNLGEDVERLAESSSFLKFGDSIDRTPAMAGRFAIAMGDSASASLDTEGAVALGAYAVASGTNSVALGRGSHVHEGAARGFALGTESQVAESGAIAIDFQRTVAPEGSNSLVLIPTNSPDATMPVPLDLSKPEGATWSGGWSCRSAMSNLPQPLLPSECRTSK